MGKTDFNGLSQWTGRIGGLVFKVVNGQQVITPYKKEVFNPRSEAQMLHRAKFALSGMINKIVPKEVLVGMSPDRRSRRLLFASNIIRHANVSVDSGVVKATLNANDLVFSQGQQETLTSPELRQYISKQIDRGSGNVVQYEVEYHKRIATSFASFILTIIGVSLSSRKRKGGMGLYLGIGLALSFSYILLQTISATFAINADTPPMLAAWIPNILYVFIAYFCYRQAPN